MNHINGEEGKGENPNGTTEEAVQPMTAEEIKLKELKRLKKKRYLDNKKKKWYATKMNTYIYI